MTADSPRPPDPPPAASMGPSAPPVWKSEDIFQGTRTVEIVHQGERYRLLITRNGKLILQK